MHTLCFSVTDFPSETIKRKDQFNHVDINEVLLSERGFVYDLIVVGGGPSGSMCAREAAAQGLDVLLLEKETLPRNKLCGGALSARVTEVLDFEIRSVVQHEIHCAVVHAPSGRKVTIMRDDTRGYLIKRSEFDSLLLDKARSAGAEVADGAKVIAVDQLKKGVRVLTPGDSYGGRLLVGADGVNSTIGRSVGLVEGWPADRVALCIALDVPLPADEIQRIMTPEDSSSHVAIEIYPWIMPHGYAWCFPKQDEISLGIGYTLKYGVLNIRDAWKEFVETFEREKRVDLGINRIQAHRVPLAKFDRQLTTRRTMLVGDAAGLASPVTGEGIYYAIRSGIIAGQVASEVVSNRDYRILRDYEERVKREFKTEFSAANCVSNVVYKSYRNVELICELAEQDPIMQDLMIDLALGTRSISKIRLDITKRMITRYPLKALKLLR
jgi:geranylgeranyl reductase family protein